MKVRIQDWFILKNFLPTERDIYNLHTSASIERETEKAYLISMRTDALGIEKWIPRSVVSFSGRQEAEFDPPVRRRRGDPEPKPEPDTPPKFRPEPRRDIKKELNEIWGVKDVEIVIVDSDKVEPVITSPDLKKLIDWIDGWGIPVGNLKTFDGCEIVLKKYGLYELAQDKNKI